VGDVPEVFLHHLQDLVAGPQSAVLVGSTCRIGNNYKQLDHKKGDTVNKWQRNLSAKTKAELSLRVRIHCISVADPDPGSVAFLTTGPGMGKKTPDPG
jgi:hypothetical protein